MAGEVRHVMVFPDGGLGCLRCGGMTRPAFDLGMRALAQLAQVFLKEHAGCTGTAPAEVLALAAGLNNKEGLA